MVDITIVTIGLSGGGTEKESITFANFLASKGYKVKVVASHRTVHFFELNRTIEFAEPKFNREKYTLFIYTLKILFFLRYELKKSGCKVVLSYNEYLNPYTAIAAKLARKKIFVRESMHPKAKLPIVSEFLRRCLYPFTSGIFVQTNYGKQILAKKIFLGNIYVLPNTIDFPEIKNELRKNWIVSVGRLEKVKGHSYLIEAFAKVKNLEWELHFVGDGTLRDELQILAERNKLSEQVIFHGHLLEFNNILASSKIFVLPSIKEGFPNALVEAMSIPLPCIAGDYYQGSVEIIDNGVNGLLFEPMNVLDLSEKLQILMTDEKLCKDVMGESEKVKDKYNINVIGNQYIQILGL